MARGNAMTFAAVGDPLNNGFDVGGARMYPFSTGLAISPPAEYSNYIGNASGVPISPPVEATPMTTGTTSTNGALTVQAITSAPFDVSKSPLPWVVLGLFGAVAAMHFTHYK